MANLKNDELNDIEELNTKLKCLQDILATIDLLCRPASSGRMEILIKQHLPLTLRMDANKNHARAHIHLDYGKERHTASYAIDNGERLAGNISQYDNAIAGWINQNRATLEQVWTIIRNSPQPDALVAQLKASPL